MMKAMKVVAVSLAAVALAAGAFFLCGSLCVGSAGGEDYGDTCVVEEIEAEYGVSTGDTATYDWNLISEYGDIRIRWDTGCGYREEADDMDHKEYLWIKRFVGDAVADSALIVGPYRNIIGRGRRLLVVSGVDTLRLDIRRQLPRVVDVRHMDERPGCRRYRLSRHYALNDSSWTTDFQLNISMQDSTPPFIVRFISGEVRDYVAGFFPSCIGSRITRIGIYNADRDDIEPMMRYYYRQFRSLYRREWGPLSEDDIRDGLPVVGERYSLQLYVYPVWSSGDGSLTTWRFYAYTYRGGAHGNEDEYFLTFDNATHRILGISDFFRRKDIPRVYDTLTRQLNAYHDRTPDDEYAFAADLEFSGPADSDSVPVLYELYDGKLYPRPALTPQGIVFSYQKYLKGGNIDGVLHFTQPFRRDFRLRARWEGR